MNDNFEERLNDEQKIDLFFEELDKDKEDILIDTVINCEDKLFNLLNNYTKHQGREITEIERNAILNDAIQLIDAVHNDLLLRYV